MAKQTKLQRLVAFLEQSSAKKQTVSRKVIEKRFKQDRSFVVYFNGLRRNGAVSSTGTVFPSKIRNAIKSFRVENRKRQIAHYQRKQTEQTA